MVSSVRPPLAPALSSREFQRWYWMKRELVDFARQEAMSSTGDKPTLTKRIVVFLDGADLNQPTAATKTRRATVSRRLPAPLTVDTVLGPKQASSQQLRAFFVSTVGPRFSYDIHMRTFLASDREKTLGEAVEHWHASRNSVKPETLPQLELVRFMKAWHLQNPVATQKECREAWKLYKSLPSDERAELPGF
jgi:SAP domain-containing new25/Domain of unknown function (DUF6434)